MVGWHGGEEQDPFGLSGFAGSVALGFPCVFPFEPGGAALIVAERATESHRCRLPLEKAGGARPCIAAWAGYRGNGALVSIVGAVGHLLFAYDPEISFIGARAAKREEIARVWEPSG